MMALSTFPMIGAKRSRNSFQVYRWASLFLGIGWMTVSLMVHGTSPLVKILLMISGKVCPLCRQLSVQGGRDRLDPVKISSALVALLHKKLRRSTSQLCYDAY